MLRATPGGRPAFDVVASKLQPPWSRPGLVDRASLLDRLLTTSGRLIGVVAPSGYGKTTMLAQWAAQTPRRSAWLSLDERDNDPPTFMRYVAAALDQVGSIDARFVRHLSSDADVDADEVLGHLTSAVRDTLEPFDLVLDQLHVIRDQRCWDAISELALHVPLGSILALASRTELPIAIVQLRDRGAVVDVRADDLAMNRDEVIDLVIAADVALSADELSDLLDRTEGWPAALYLAMLAAKADGPRPGIRPALRGDDRLIADYLRAEVLGRMPPATRSFLTRTSVLDRLCGPLCDAVLATHGSQEILESVVGLNVLLIPLDSRSQWFRCHRLLRDLLLADLARAESELVPRLHDRAAAWFETNQRPDLAIDHAQAAGDGDRAARLVAGLAPSTVGDQSDTVLRWLGWFDAQGLIARYPHVAVTGAHLAAQLGFPTRAELWADAAVSGSFDGSLPDGSPLASWVALLDATLCRHGVARMRADADEAHERLAPGSPWSGPAMFMVAMSRLLGGDDVDAIDDLLQRTVDVAIGTKSMPTAAAALAERAVIAIERHDWVTAAAFSSEAVAIEGRASLDAVLHTLVVHAVAARVAVHHGDADAARVSVARAGQLRPLCSAAAPFSAHFLLQLAQADVEMGDTAATRAVLRQIRDILDVRPDVGIVGERAAQLQLLVDAVPLNRVAAPSFTAAELRLLPLLPTHLSYDEIGERLFVSRNTVKTHAASIFRKLGVSSRREAIEAARALGLLGG